MGYVDLLVRFGLDNCGFKTILRWLLAPRLSYSLFSVVCHYDPDSFVDVESTNCARKRQQPWGQLDEDLRDHTGDMCSFVYRQWDALGWLGSIFTH